MKRQVLIVIVGLEKALYVRRRTEEFSLMSGQSSRCFCGGSMSTSSSTTTTIITISTTRNLILIEHGSGRPNSGIRYVIHTNPIL